MKFSVLALISALGCVGPVGCSGQEPVVPGSQTTAGEVAAIAGTYRRATPSNGELVLSVQGESWRVSVSAAGVPNGAGTAADCQISALGPLVDQRITAIVAPAETEDGGIPGDVFQNPAGALVLVVGDGEVRIIEETASGEACGPGLDLSGTYIRD